jgi:CTP synthase
VVCLLDDQYSITDMGGTMRLGTYPCKLKEGSKAYNAYGAAVVHERHRHRYEFNNKFKSQYEKHGMVFSGTSPDGNLVEAIEIADHPWFLAVQSHPEFKSKPTSAHPLFQGFVKACGVYQENKVAGKK